MGTPMGTEAFLSKGDSKGETQKGTEAFFEPIQGLMEGQGQRERAMPRI